MRDTPITWPGHSSQPAPPDSARYYSLRYNGRHLLLPQGEFVVGRSRSCDLVLEDMLVSRRHVRLLVSHDSLFVEDLSSANGVCVNEQVVTGAVRLRHGDRVLVGAHELTIEETGNVDRDRPTPPASSQRVAKPTNVKTDAKPLLRIPVTSTKRSSSSHPGFDGEDTLRTEKQDGLLMMARLADRMMSLGRRDAAVRLLGDNLRELAGKVKQGRDIPDQTLMTLGIYGMRLAEFTRDGTWANVAVDAFAAAGRPLPEKAIAVLERHAHELPNLDRQKLLHYKATLRELAEVFSTNDQALVERILRVPTR